MFAELTLEGQYPRGPLLPWGELNRHIAPVAGCLYTIDELPAIVGDSRAYVPVLKAAPMDGDLPFARLVS